YPGEERKHHQGGAIGYRAREWVAHPGSAEVVQPRQAFAWNPTITGTKIEDTALLLDGRLEIIMTSPDWPSIPLAHGLTASDVWPLLEIRGQVCKTAFPGARPPARIRGQVCKTSPRGARSRRICALLPRSRPTWHGQVSFCRPDPRNSTPAWHLEAPFCRPDP